MGPCALSSPTITMKKGRGSQKGKESEDKEVQQAEECHSLFAIHSMDRGHGAQTFRLLIKISHSLQQDCNAQSSSQRLAEVTEHRRVKILLL